VFPGVGDEDRGAQGGGSFPHPRASRGGSRVSGGSAGSAVYPSAASLRAPWAGLAVKTRQRRRRSRWFRTGGRESRSSKTTRPRAGVGYTIARAARESRRRDITPYARAVHKRVTGRVPVAVAGQKNNRSTLPSLRGGRGRRTELAEIDAKPARGSSRVRATGCLAAKMSREKGDPCTPPPGLAAKLVPSTNGGRPARFPGVGNVAEQAQRRRHGKNRGCQSTTRPGRPDHESRPLLKAQRRPRRDSRARSGGLTEEPACPDRSRQL